MNQTDCCSSDVCKCSGCKQSCKRHNNGFVHFMTFSAILVQVHFLPCPHISQAVKKEINGFIHSMKFPAILVQVHLGFGMGNLKNDIKTS